MNKRELVAAVARQSGLTQDQVVRVLEAIVEVITETLRAGQVVALASFGRFETKGYAGRRIRHPRTRQLYDTASHPLPVFHAYPLLKRRVSKPAKPETRR